MKQKVIRIILLILVLDIIILFLDYKNIICEENINSYLVTALISNSVTIILYYITFAYIDKNTIKNNDNQYDIAKLMLQNTYSSVAEIEEMLTVDVIRDNIVPKCEFNKILHEDTYLYNLTKSPFSFDSAVMEFAKKGVISKKDFSDYLLIKKRYTSFITMSVTFYDNKQFSGAVRDQLREALNSTQNR